MGGRRDRSAAGHQAGTVSITEGEPSPGGSVLWLGGRHWLLIAASPRWNQAGTGPGTLPSACDKTGIGFATPTDGWLTGTWIRVQPARARCRACRVTNLLLPAAHRPGDPPCHRERCEGPIFLRPGGTRWTSTTRTGSCAEWPARPGSPSPSARTLHHAFLTLCVTKRHPCAQADLPVVTEHGQRSKSSTRTSPPFGADIGSNATVILPPRSG